MESITIRLGGVPEHFNLPIHLGIENGIFEANGINIEWTTFKGGTGQMTKALRENEIDVCVLLTEGIVNDIIAGNPSKIVSVYVQSPLIWGIHTGVKNNLEKHEDIYDKQYAISRFGSGSHLMAIVDATVHNKKISEHQFTVIKNLDGALESLKNFSTDVFYWEKFTTKPYVDGGQLRRVGEFLTPWPCFVIAATDKTLNHYPQAIHTLLQLIHEQCIQFMQSENNISLVSSRYNQKLEDVKEWYKSTKWATDNIIYKEMILEVIQYLELANIIEKNINIPDLIWHG